MSHLQDKDEEGDAFKSQSRKKQVLYGLALTGLSGAALSAAYYASKDTEDSKVLDQEKVDDLGFF